MAWTLWQYQNIVDDFFCECGVNIEAEMKWRLGELLKKGNLCGRPISAPVGHGTGLLEVRARVGNLQPRMLYFFQKGQKIVIVHAFIKESSAISQHDLEVALRNKHAIEEGRERAHGADLTH